MQYTDPVPGSVSQFGEREPYYLFNFLLSHQGHGEYTEIDGEKEFFTVCNKSENVVCHFYKNDTPRCKIVDMHLKILAKKHVETRFIKLDVERAPFLTGMLALTIRKVTRTIYPVGVVRDARGN